MQATNDLYPKNPSLRQTIRDHMLHWAILVFVWLVFSMVASSIFDSMQLSWVSCKIMYILIACAGAVHVVMTLATDIEQICVKHSK